MGSAGEAGTGVVRVLTPVLGLDSVLRLGHPRAVTDPALRESCGRED
jgi:hypothetical protein